VTGRAGAGRPLWFIGGLRFWRPRGNRPATPAERRRQLSACAPWFSRGNRRPHGPPFSRENKRVPRTRPSALRQPNRAPRTRSRSACRRPSTSAGTPARLAPRRPHPCSHVRTSDPHPGPSSPENKALPVGRPARPGPAPAAPPGARTCPSTAASASAAWSSMPACSHVRTAGCPPAPGLIHRGAAKQTAGARLERSWATDRPSCTRKEHTWSQESGVSPPSRAPRTAPGVRKQTVHKCSQSEFYSAAGRRAACAVRASVDRGAVLAAPPKAPAPPRGPPSAPLRLCSGNPASWAEGQRWT